MVGRRCNMEVVKVVEAQRREREKEGRDAEMCGRARWQAVVATAETMTLRQ
jgi:hypothetical protein